LKRNNGFGVVQIKSEWSVGGLSHLGSHGLWAYGLPEFFRERLRFGLSMLVRLTRAGRLRAGKILASIYMLCILMPALSFAYADGALAAPCLTDPDHAMGIVHVHETAAGTVRHVHTDTHPQDHAHHAKAGHHDDGGIASHSATASADTQSPSPPAHDDHKAPGAQCCGMVCISALPASVTDFVAPTAPTSRCASETYRNVAGKAPPTLYRPPIS
jgi:hypothetical protein